ncbi:craniofacial development protein 2-like [Danaus plexippus]|uniref:craniofacial development protein 2-like n=1 Tax=Danaus plexippus TaxID=13037 RepID=UPI002AAFEB7F|nr:craniofacial development protein 2-like [Danaus plexippus]
MKIRTRIACWNVRTLSEDSRLAQAGAEMLRYKLQILGLSEVRRNGFGEWRMSGGLTFLYSGKEDEEEVRENGVGFLLSDAAKKSLRDWKPISERIITSRSNSRARKITVVQCYAPTNLASEEDKDDFYSALNLTIKNICKQDIVIVMGDLNAKYTWNSPDGVTKNQIDRRGANIDGDHDLLVAKVRLKVAVTRPTNTTPKFEKRFEIIKLQDPVVGEAFKVSLRNRFSALEADYSSVNAEWNYIKMAYTETSSVVLGYKRHRREDWMSQRT